MHLYSKSVVQHPHLYISRLVNDPANPYLIFIHGGPGMNCGIVEHLVEKEGLFDALGLNVIFYDQRGCGRSASVSEYPTHKENIDDLQNVYHHVTCEEKVTVVGFIGHSYGAKLLCDFLYQTGNSLPALFLSMSESLLIPRINNVMLDLKYLQATDYEKYLEILEKMDRTLDQRSLWEVTEMLAPLFVANRVRPTMYWANRDACTKVSQIQKQLNLPLNTHTFESVRKNLYLEGDISGVNLNQLSGRALLVMGFHDYIMDGHKSPQAQTNRITFNKSGHYPHIEESEKFCRIAAEFFHVR